MSTKFLKNYRIIFWWLESISDLIDFDMKFFFVNCVTLIKIQYHPLNIYMCVTIMFTHKQISNNPSSSSLDGSVFKSIQGANVLHIIPAK